MEQWIQLAEAGKKTELYQAFGKSVYPPAVFEQSRGFLTDAAASVADEDLRRFVILAESVKDFNVTEDLIKIACPVLVIGSMDDQVLGADASAEIALHLKDQCGPVLVMYKGYGHAVYDTAPDYREQMVKFLAG